MSAVILNDYINSINQLKKDHDINKMVILIHKHCICLLLLILKFSFEMYCFQSFVHHLLKYFLYIFCYYYIYFAILKGSEILFNELLVYYSHTHLTLCPIILLNSCTDFSRIF